MKGKLNGTYKVLKEIRKMDKTNKSWLMEEIKEDKKKFPLIPLDNIIAINVLSVWDLDRIPKKDYIYLKSMVRSYIKCS